MGKRFGMFYSDFQKDSAMETFTVEIFSKLRLVHLLYLILMLLLLLIQLLISQQSQMLPTSISLKQMHLMRH